MEFRDGECLRHAKDMVARTVNQSKSFFCSALALVALIVSSSTWAAQAEIISPAPGSYLVSSPTQFTWTPDGEAVAFYYIFVGTTQFGTDQGFYYFPGNTTSGSIPVPVVDMPIHITLYSPAGYSGYVYNTGGSVSTNFEITTPPDGTTLADKLTRIDWTWPGNQPVAGFSLLVGTGPGGSDMHSQTLSGAARSAPMNIPLDGSPVHVTLVGQPPFSDTDEDSTPQIITTTYQSTVGGSDSGAQLTSPANGTTISEESALFQWIADEHATSYSLKLGTVPGSGNVGSVNVPSTTTETTMMVALTGNPVHATLTTQWANGASYSRSYVYQTPLADSDDDGVGDSEDLCPDTPPTETANEDGCSPSQLDSDSDGDGVNDDIDQCPDSPPGISVGAEGCADSDEDGIPDNNDSYPYQNDTQCAA